MGNKIERLGLLFEKSPENYTHLKIFFSISRLIGLAPLQKINGGKTAIES